MTFSRKYLITKMQNAQMAINIFFIFITIET